MAIFIEKNRAVYRPLTYAIGLHHSMKDEAQASNHWVIGTSSSSYS